jgi:hypothetical protein
MHRFSVPDGQGAARMWAPDSSTPEMPSAPGRCCWACTAARPATLT